MAYILKLKTIKVIRKSSAKDYFLNLMEWNLMESHLKRLKI